jgi:hypothetical protein
VRDVVRLASPHSGEAAPAETVSSTVRLPSVVSVTAAVNILRFIDIAALFSNRGRTLRTAAGTSLRSCGGVPRRASDFAGRHPGDALVGISTRV